MTQRENGADKLSANLKEKEKKVETIRLPSFMSLNMSAQERPTVHGQF